MPEGGRLKLSHLHWCIIGDFNDIPKENDNEGSQINNPLLFKVLDKLF